MATPDSTDATSSGEVQQNEQEEQTNLSPGTILKKGDTEYQIIEDVHFDRGLVATEIGDRELTDHQVPEVGDDYILPECDGTVEDVNDRRWCSEGCLEWMRETPAQDDNCDKYGNKCDGKLDATINDDGSVEYECSSCGKSGWSARITWREAWLPFNDRSTEANELSEEAANAA